MSEERKYMDIKEFRDKGYLMEVNRQFFHPLGLALEVTVEEDGSMRLTGIWDYRDDPEGMMYDDTVFEGDDTLKVHSIEAERQGKAAVRTERFGWVVQPIPGAGDEA